MLAVLAAVGVSLASTGSRPGAGGPRRGSDTASQAISPGGIGSSAAARSAAAAWADRTRPATALACDPAMCLALRSGGFASSDLVRVNPARGYPLGSTVIIATAAVRNQLAPGWPASTHRSSWPASAPARPGWTSGRSPAAPPATARRWPPTSPRGRLAARSAAQRRGDRVPGRPPGHRPPGTRTPGCSSPWPRRPGGRCASCPSPTPRRALAAAAGQVGRARGAARLRARGGYLRPVLGFLQAGHGAHAGPPGRECVTGAACVLQIDFPAPTPLGLLARRAPG